MLARKHWLSSLCLAIDFEGLAAFKKANRSSHCGSVVTNPTNIHEDTGLIPSLAQWVKDLALP